MASVRLIETDRCPPGKGVFVSAGGRELAVFHLTDPQRFAVIDNSCPHASGNLAGGELAGCIVSCPWHHWEFDVTTGRCTHSEAAKVNSYPVEIRDRHIYADLHPQI
jgi:nitrite reductase/ring-hydroxylating ferredoxin subunit